MKKALVCFLLISLMISSLSIITLAKQQPPVIDYTDNTPNIYGDIAKIAESRIEINSFNYNINMWVPSKALTPKFLILPWVMIIALRFRLKLPWSIKAVLFGYIKQSVNTHYVVVKAAYGQGASLSDR